LIPTVNAFVLSQYLPNAQLILYPDAGHGCLFQYPEWFVDDASRFLDRT
jgi:pimeloyl-ACP methyl ester carboxylesterase